MTGIDSGRNPTKQAAVNPEGNAPIRESGFPGDGVQAWSLVEPVAPPQSRPALEKVAIKHLSYHSARVEPGTLFFCLPGGKVDGHCYAREAVSRGAAAVVASRPVDVGVPLILVDDSRFALSLISARFFGFPGNRMNLIGVTGTNGKTTTTYYIHSIFRAAGHKAAILGSNGLLSDGLRRSFDLTTPQSLELQESLAFVQQRGVEVVAMEASSHALVQQRLSHCFFDGAVFTNLTRDHLDYHRSMQDYWKAKCKLFTLLKEKAGAGAVLNTDDGYFKQFSAAAAGRRLITYGIKDRSAAVRAVDLSVTAEGRYSFVLRGWPAPLRISLPLPGLFNVYNALAAAAVAWKDGLDPEAVVNGLHGLTAVPGRLEEIATGAGFTVIIDYAHTPDGLEQVLKLLRSREPRRIITLFGCPGERDRGKRPIMGRIAERYSSRVILTADNPAGENAETIIREIKQGMRTDPILIPDRREAVGYALEQASSGDLVLLAGKGAEEYQLIGDSAVPYSDRETVEAYLLNRSDH